MHSRHTKRKVFVLEALNSMATSYYFYYLFFFLRAEFKFGDLGNLVFCALNGFVYMFAAWFGGRFAQKHGYLFALRLGFSIAALALGVGSQVANVPAHLVVMVGWTIGVCFIWPTLEALVSERESGPQLQRMVGIYNIVWAAANAVAYFTGGAMLEHFGLRSIFYVPLALHVLSLVLLFNLERRVRAFPTAPPSDLVGGTETSTV